MTAIADEIRAASSRNEVHPLVKDNWASPRGLCNCWLQSCNGMVWCQLDFGHDGIHINFPNQWSADWPPKPFR